MSGGITTHRIFNTIRGEKMNNKIKRIISVMLAVLLLFGALPAQSLPVFGDLRLFANAADSDSDCGDNLIWSYSNQTLSIRTKSPLVGSGRMNNYTATRHAPWYDYRESIKRISFSGRITHIGNYAFAETAITSISIPSKTATIGSYAFYKCGSLKGVSLPNSITEIGAYAFSESSITISQIPYGTISIGQYAFRNCSSLTKVFVPETVQQFGTYPFYGTSAEVICRPGTYAYTHSSQYISTVNGVRPTRVSIYDKYPILNNPTTQLNGHTYVLYPNETDWESANYICKMLGGHLATVTSDAEHNEIVSMIPSSDSKTGYWLGGFDTAGDNTTWSWVTGETFDESFSETMWHSGEPSDSSEQALEYYKKSGQWRWNDEASTSTERGFVLELDACYVPVASKQVGQTLYMVFDEPLSWKDAKEYCKNMGGHLVVIGNDNEKK